MGLQTLPKIRQLNINIARDRIKIDRRFGTRQESIPFLRHAARIEHELQVWLRAIEGMACQM